MDAGNRVAKQIEVSVICTHHNHSRRRQNLYDNEWWDFFAKPLASVKRINDYDDLRDFVSCGVKQEISL